MLKMILIINKYDICLRLFEIDEHVHIQTIINTFTRVNPQEIQSFINVMSK